MNARGWADFEERPWPEIASGFRDLADADDRFCHMAAIAESVITGGAEERLAGATSEHDLVVAASPVPTGLPVDVVIVRSPSSGLVGPGWVLIEHRSTTGQGDDRISRPSDAAVPLFWRFMIETFGVEPIHRR